MPPVGLAKNAAGQVEGYEVFIRGLAAEATQGSLRAFFEDAGDIVDEPRLMTDTAGNCKGLGWITFSSEAGFVAAQARSGRLFLGKRIEVRAAKQFHTGIRPSVQAPGTHTPALCKEVVHKMVSPNTGGVYVDGTFGRGGHSRAILAALSPAGRLHAFDMDPEAIKVGKELMAADSRFTIHHAPFSSMRAVLKPLGVSLAGAFFDLGISSPQFDDAGRGFRPEADGPLDLRFDQSQGVPAHEFLRGVARDELARIIHDYGETGDEVASQRIADAICLARTAGRLPERTREFAALVAQAKGKEYQAMHPAKMTFQALRMHLNDEIGEMRRGMLAAFRLLGDGGRIGLLTWKHSECNVVVDVFRSLEAVREKEPLLKWYREQAGAPALPEGPSMEMDDVVRPSEQELQMNSRSRSALLHVLRKRRLPRLARLEELARGLPGWSAALAPVVVASGGAVTEPARKKRRREAAPPEGGDAGSPAAPSAHPLPPTSAPLSGECGHCGGAHPARRCTFGACRRERYLPCAGSAPHLPCFWRRFVVPLSRADAGAFDPADPRGSGRADVGLRCLSAALFRSQGLRKSTQVCLCFGESGHTLEVTGALARGLVPDEGRLAARLRRGLDALLRPGAEAPLPDPAEEPEAWCSHELRGVEARARSTERALRAALRAREARDLHGGRGRVALLLLAADGVPVGEACRQLRSGPALAGVVVVVGDHRGYSEEEAQGYCAVAEAAGSEVLRISLGRDTLLASHAITVLTHYLDEMLHSCEVAGQVDYGRRRAG